MSEAFDYAKGIQKASTWMRDQGSSCTLMTELAGLVARADYGHYGGLFHFGWPGTAAGQRYRIGDGRAAAPEPGQAALPRPFNSWPDKTRETSIRRAGCLVAGQSRKIRPQNLPGPDLMILAGNGRPRGPMGFKTFGFGGGREDTLGACTGHLLGPRRPPWLGG